MMAEKVLSDIYYDISNPGSYGGLESLFREASKKLPELKKNDVRNWLSGQLVYTLHKPARRRFKRNPIVAEHVNENFQADLVDMQTYARQNDNNRYLLTTIDIFSKKVWAVPIKNKQATTVSSAMENVIRSNTPIKLQTDKGKEFDNIPFKKLMDKYNINFFTSNNKDIKCSIIERFNRTLKNKLHRHFTKTGKKRYVDILDQLVRGYNNSYHRSIKMTPNQVNEDNEKEVFYNLYGFVSKRELLRKLKMPALRAGDKVRQKYILGPLDRGYYPNWTDQVYTIIKTVKNINKPLYFVKNSDGAVVKQRFYPEEIQKIKENNIFRVERVISEKVVGGKKYFKVKWLNHPSSENSWIESSDLFNIGDGE
jgi:hypothetical protein